MIAQRVETHQGLLKAYAAFILSTAAGKLDSRFRGQNTKVENQLKVPVAALHIINDFNDHASPVQCDQIVRDVFHRNNTVYEAPHVVSDVEQFNITHGAYRIYQLVKNSQHHEISKGIFVGVIDPGVGSGRRGIVVTTEEGYTFVGPDNGLFSPVLATLKIKEAYKINQDAFEESSRTFHGRDQFTPVGAEIATGKDPSSLRSRNDQSKPVLERITPDSLIKKEFIAGQVVEIDGYNVKLWQKGIPTNGDGEKANSVTITSPRLFRRGLGWSHSIEVPVVNTFADVEVGKWLAYEGSSGRTKDDNTGLVEIGIREGAKENSAGRRLKIHVGDVLNLNWNYRKRK